jgi:hypothetical protein
MRRSLGDEAVARVPNAEHPDNLPALTLLVPHRSIEGELQKLTIGHYVTAASISFPASGSIPPPQFRSHIEAHRRFGASRRRAEKRRWARPSRRLIGRRS